MLLTAKELATALDVHITTIRRAYRSKRIPYERFCKLYFFDLIKVRNAMRQDGLDLTAIVHNGKLVRFRPPSSPPCSHALRNIKYSYISASKAHSSGLLRDHCP